MSEVIKLLQDYQDTIARIKVLKLQPLGMGYYTVADAAKDDKLMELHKQLRGLPSYMYLTPREQQLESSAHMHLTRYPAGIQSQYREVAGLKDDDPEEAHRLHELRESIGKVLEARTCQPEGIDEVLERMTELQGLEAKREYYNNALEVLDERFPGYGRLLHFRYAEGKAPAEIMQEMQASKTTYYRWEQEAIAELSKILNVGKRRENIGTRTGRQRHIRRGKMLL